MGFGAKIFRCKPGFRRVRTLIVRPVSYPLYFEAKNYTLSRKGNSTNVTVSKDLAGGVFYYWYLDGEFVGQTSTPSKMFLLEGGAVGGDFRQVVCLESNVGTLDLNAIAPVGYPAYRTLNFIRSLDPAIAEYLIEQQINGGSWTALARVKDDPRRWAYSVRTGRLADLTNYAWRITPIGQDGNSGTPAALAAEFIVRTPDAPDFSLTFNASPRTVTVAA